MPENIAKKVTKGNYKVNQLSAAELANMTEQDIKNAAAILIMKGKPGVQVVSVTDMSILAQSMCPLPMVVIQEVDTVIRHVDQLPNGQPFISYFGIAPSREVLASLIKLAKTAKEITGGIFSGYATLTTVMGEEKHFSPGIIIPKGMTNIRIAKDEVVFSLGTAVKKIALNDFVDQKWANATEINTFAKKVLFLDRVQNGTTNIVTEDVIAKSFDLFTKKAATIQRQSDENKVLSYIQWKKNALITTSLGLTQEPAFARAV